MPALNTTAGSISPPQRQRLFGIMHHRGWSHDELRAAVPGGSISRLSRAQASACIDQLGGGKLSHPPGQKPKPARRAKQTGVTRMISPDQVEQIERMLLDYFGSAAKAASWLAKNFEAACVRDLATAQRAGQVIHVLRTMHARRTTNKTTQTATPDAAQH